MNNGGMFLHRLRERWMLLPESPGASRWLFLVAFVEASIFPIPPDYLLVALSIARPKTSFAYAAISAAGSVAGALLGYFVGAALYDAVGERLVGTMGFAASFAAVLSDYRDSAWLAIVGGGFVPVPFFIFTMAAGFNGAVSLATFLPAVIVGRGLRFFLAGLVLHLFAPSLRAQVHRRFGVVMLTAGLLGAGGLVTALWIS